jgi:hypothetical protein
MRWVGGRVGGWMGGWVDGRVQRGWTGVLVEEIDELKNNHQFYLLVPMGYSRTRKIIDESMCDFLGYIAANYPQCGAACSENAYEICVL